MSILDCVKVLLRRELSDEECKVLRHLTVQGLAKLNCDISREVELEVTMAIFRVVYRRMETRRESIVSQIAPEVQAAVEKMNRMATAEELIFLNDCYEANLFKNLISPEGELLDDFDLENSAVAYLYTELGMEADRLRSGLQAGLRPAVSLVRKAPVSTPTPTPSKSGGNAKCTVCHLAPMACPISFTSATMVRTDEFHRMSIGFSPMVTWFNTSQAEPLLVSPAAVHALLTSRTAAIPLKLCVPSASTSCNYLASSPPSCFDFSSKSALSTLSTSSSYGLSFSLTPDSIPSYSLSSTVSITESDSLSPRHNPNRNNNYNPSRRVRFVDNHQPPAPSSPSLVKPDSTIKTAPAPSQGITTPLAVNVVTIPQTSTMTTSNSDANGVERRRVGPTTRFLRQLGKKLRKEDSVPRRFSPCEPPIHAQDISGVFPTSHPAVASTATTTSTPSSPLFSKFLTALGIATSA